SFIAKLINFLSAILRYSTASDENPSFPVTCTVAFALIITLFAFMNFNFILQRYIIYIFFHQNIQKINSHILKDFYQILISISSLIKFFMFACSIAFVLLVVSHGFCILNLYTLTYSRNFSLRIKSSLFHLKCDY